MLTHLQLRDLVIVDQAELDFGPGLTALTGETGAGKSIVVDALLLVAGGRASGDVVRHGAQRAEVAAGFSALPDGARAWLEEQAIEHDGEVVVRRVIGLDGRSRAYVNGQLVPLQLLRDFAEFLIEIHGQQEFQHLVKRSAQRRLLDEHLDDPALPAAVAEAHAAARACRDEHAALAAAAADREARLDLLRHQWAELKAEVSTAAAIEELFAEQKRISARGRLGDAARTALLAAYDGEDHSAHDLLARAAAALRSVADADPLLAAPAQLLGEAAIVTQEAAETLRRYLDGLDVDPARQEEIERRAAVLEGLARKHRVPLGELPDTLARMTEEIRSLDTVEESLAALEQRLAALTARYRAAAERLSAARQRAAAILGEDITRLMQVLGMKGGRFAVRVEPRGDTTTAPASGQPETDRPQMGHPDTSRPEMGQPNTGRPDSIELGAHGIDEIEFLVSANPGQPLKSLAKVASGGELSRISLAVRVAAAGGSSVCMVFDEVDAGIGGATAEIVGRQLRELGREAQVLCVTHLGQVASQAHNQFQVTKQTDGRSTRTEVRTLNPHERVDEVARMLGGIDITDQAREHARDMLTRAAALKPKAKRAKSARH